MGYCPLHDERRYNKDAFSLNTSRNIFHCFACGASGNVLDFVCQREDLEPREAALADLDMPPGPTVRIAKTVLRRGLSAGALVLYGARQALWQVGGRKPKQADLAAALGVSERSVKAWAAELRAAALDEYDRPTRRFLRAPVALLVDPSVSHQAKATALHLLALVGEDGVAEVGQAPLSQACGLSEVTVYRHLRALRETGHLMTLVASFNPEAGRRERCNRYVFVTLRAPQPQGLSAQKGKHAKDRVAAPAQKGKHAKDESKPLLARVQTAVKPLPGTLGEEEVATREGAAPAAGATPTTGDTEEQQAAAIALAAGLQATYVLALVRRHGLQQVAGLLGRAGR